MADIPEIQPDNESEWAFNWCIRFPKLERLMQWTRSRMETHFTCINAYIVTFGLVKFCIFHQSGNY